ncbi:MAG: zinc-ribbon domain-containing protein, partial [Anaerolineae bacterium]|nr:zinc-ribbon domain-containing protein [Anaerolineae bacterium]
AEAFEAEAVTEAPTAISVVPEEIPEVVEEPEVGLRCAQCGAELSSDMRFCGVCGAPVSGRWQPPASPPTTVPEPLVTTVEERRPERSKPSLMIAGLGAGLLAVIVLAIIVSVIIIRGGVPSVGGPTVAGGMGGTVVSKASDTPSPTVVPTEAQPTATVTVISTPTATPTVPATASPTLIKATSTPTRVPATPLPTATPVPPTPTRLPPTRVPPTKPPAITSHKNMIVFKSDREGGEAKYVMNPDGSDQRRLDDESVYDNAFALEAISPDGKWRLEVREIEGNVDIWRVNIAGTPPDYRITSNAEIDQEPAWAPIDPNRIAFVSDRMGNTDIWTQNVSEPLDERQLTDNPDYDKHPSWSPDGTQIVYWAVHQGGPRQIRVMNGDGSNKRNISNNIYNDWDPIWIKQP